MGCALRVSLRLFKFDPFKFIGLPTVTTKIAPSNFIEPDDEQNLQAKYIKKAPQKDEELFLCIWRAWKDYRPLPCGL